MSCTLAALAATLAGCATVDPAPRVRQEAVSPAIAQPQARPVRTITSMTPALRCMQDRLALYRVNPVVFGLSDIRDETRSMNVGTRDMFATAFGQMRTRDVRVNLLLPPVGAIGSTVAPSITINQPEMQVLGLTASGTPIERPKPGTFDLATYLITGSISAVDREVVSGQTDGAGRAGASGAGVSRSSKAKLISVDLQATDRASNLQLPGAAFSNSIAIVEDATGVDATLGFTKFGANFSSVSKRAESDGKALRMLFEMGAVELVGRSLTVPYWNCLGGDTSSPEAMAEIQTIQDDWLGLLSGQGHPKLTNLQVWLIRALDARGYLNLGGLPNPDKMTELDRTFLRTARRQALADLGQDPRVDDEPTAFRALVRADAGPRAVLPVWGLQAEHQLSYRDGDVVSFKVLSEEPGHLSCYLQDSSRRVMRVFPVVPGQPDRIERAKPLVVPGHRDVRLRAVATPGLPPAEMLCVNTSRPLDGQPQFRDVAPMQVPLPVQGLQALAQRFQRDGEAMGLVGAYRFHVLVDGH